MPSEAANEQAIAPIMFWRGAAACSLFAVGAVLVRGVRWDETWEHAQILAGAVGYPEGHPLALYVHNAFSLQTHLSAWLLSAGLGPWVVCGLRNLLFLLASLLPVYVLTAWLARSAVAGLLAGLLLLQGILLEFDGSYPTMVWPELYSNGHIGGGVVLMALFALIAGARRTAYFLIGLIPCIHVGQWPPLLGTALLYAIHAGWQLRMGRAPGGPPAASCLGYFALGIGCTVSFWLLHRQFVLPLPNSGAFAAGGDAGAVWQGYTAIYDPHRHFPPGNGHVILAGTVILGWLGAFFGRTTVLRRACFWLAVYCTLIAAAVWGIMAVHVFLGPDIPFLLIAWMPYRLINHVPAIGLALMVALILARWPLRGWLIICGAGVVGLLQPIWPMIFGTVLHQRYLAGGEGVAFGLYGFSLFAAAPVRGRGRWVAIVLALATITPLAMYHRFGATCVVLGVFLGYSVDRKAGSQPIFVQPVLAVPVVLLAVGSFALLWHQFHYRKTLPVSRFQSDLARQLAGIEGVLLLAPADNLLLQATTGMPVLAEAATPSLISYLPAIGPAIDRMYAEIYGSGFRIPPPGTPAPAPWTVVWRARSEASWQALSQRYGFSHVIAPVKLPLHLPKIVAADDYGLYAVLR